ncbi:DNA primase [Cellulophaga phage Ingeline_1]|uniref:DNA primase n=1 Tax=Cellulophaga phage Ingeline_1 TaxID=2745674 RepID=A0A8E5EB54_9CAUD|nr:DNA primase [Cellulophaga phage Ingeline_1]QQV90015.1 DNA primase [Cellulophaga phage Ingeline_2]QQV90065.1 DNA primase [Cellulophaga phage Ingeline_3]QQV90115.1 DNA primase [Cellulophaga phage Ingeline_4]QQV90165.1 DNA primase [Cellulophaga phage Ingeline_5]QQV90214.1 DNA primase [Cellulophaga phage Ingeline_6]QQV90264.1 DNA primase [Cellulophaga phage Ingeline_7]QQV90316.1 DNA primase [Cellulophaga phage Ingeline_8]
MITEKSIDDVRNLEIEVVIGKYIELKRSGANYSAKSPFVAEKTGSFMVSPVKNIFKCFSSGKGGDGIGFVMEHLGLNFIDAVKQIAKDQNLFLENEQLSEEEIRNYKQKESFSSISEEATELYQQELSKLPAEHWVKIMLAERGYDQDVIIEWQLGFAPGNIISPSVVKSAKLGLAKELGLVRTKDGRNYDFFFNRLMFPIHNKQSRVIGFGARRSNSEEDAKQAKYLNSPESETYKKSYVLYGMHLAQRHIAKARKVVLVEGYTDVISMHKANVCNTVATSGTALTAFHAKELGRLADEIIIFRDGDAAGLRAAHKDIDILLSTNKKVSIVVCPEGEDPDSLSKKIQSQTSIDATTNAVAHYLESNKQDAVLWKSSELKSFYGDGPAEAANALNEIVSSLMLMDNEITRNAYIKSVAPMFKETARSLKSAIKERTSVDNAKAASSNKSVDGDLLNGLPQGADINEYLEKGFLTVGNNFWIRKDKWTKAGNFKMIPLFHVEGNKDTVRIFDVINENGEKALVEMESAIVLNKTQNEIRLIDHGFFVWNDALDQKYFRNIMQRLLRECIKVKPFDYFGWQSKGFWAFANGVFHNGKFSEVNNYGIINVEGLDEINSDYYNNTPNFYSPAYNITNKFKEDAQDLYKNDRDYIYKPAKLDFNGWMDLFGKVYPHLKEVGIAFVIATCFRDFIGNRYSAFPHLFFTGEKESGKTTAALSLAAIFTHKQKALDLNTSTMVGFSRRLERGKNTISVLEEYNDSTTDLKMKQALKGAYDFRGREIGMMTNDTRTKSSNVFCSLIILSQYLSSWDDNALTSRASNHYFAKVDEFTDAQIENYGALKEHEENGLTALVLEIVQHRNLIEQNFHEEYNKNAKKFKKALTEDFKDRVLMNFNILYTPISILYQKMKFPFTLDEIFNTCVEGIIENTDLITSTEGISEFWSALQEMFNNNMLTEGLHYDFEKPPVVSFLKSKGNEVTWKNESKDRVLYLKMNDIHGKYLDIVSRREGVDPIGKQTLINYCKGKKYFIGLVRSRRWTQKQGTQIISSHTTSGYAFNYTMLRNIINLEKDDRITSEKEKETSVQQAIEHL